VKVYLTTERPARPSRTRCLPWLLARYEQPGGHARWAAIERASGAFVGWFALTRNQPDAPPDEGEWRRVMERTGLRFVRVFHETWDDPIDGTEHGEVEYELLREEWESFASSR
jgi:hypothetical protein